MIEDAEKAPEAQAEAAVEAEAEQFRCPSCRAEMIFDAGASKMACAHCGHAMEVGGAEGHENIVEHDLEAGLDAAAERGFGALVRASQCEECGATVSFDAVVTATACDFCGSSHVLEQESNRNLIRPESVVPFQVDDGRARGQFGAWQKQLWFRPSDLKSRSRRVQISGVYVPYWTFDAGVDSSWTAQSGYYYYVDESYTTTDSQGNTVRKTRRVRKIRWRPSWGERTDAYDDVLVCASHGLPTDLAEKLKTFDTSHLKPYRPEYLSGWKAEEYAIELNAGWSAAVSKMESSQRSRCASDVPGDTHRFLRVTNRFYDETFKHVLLPIWISSYRYRDKVYRFLVNGQTGEVTGEAPWSWLKITLAVAVVVGLAVGAWLLFANG